MRNLVENVRGSVPLKAILIGTVSIFAAGCSSEVSRFSAPLFGGSSTTQYTGTISPVPSGVVEQSPLDSPMGQTGYGASAGLSSSGMAYPASSGNGTTITVQPGDSVYSIARRYGVPHGPLMQVNGLTDPMAVRPGQQLVIPVYSQATGSWQSPGSSMVSAPSPVTPEPVMAAAPAPAQPIASPQNGAAHTVRSGETVYSIGRAYGVNPHRIITANNLNSPNNIRIGQTLTIPGTQTAAAQPAQQLTVPQQQPAPRAVQTEQAAAVAANQPPKATPASYTTSGEAPSAADSRAGLPEPAELSAGKFRWPVRGRIITAFGDKADGGKNDGVNISVPEGTPVRAAENGVVAYAGSELKGYGNLVLIRHADEWVTAYAHNSELLVKRGDSISRGQVIAKAGKSGSVDSPQLHFELRKGSQPVDPLRHLSEN